MFLKCKIKVRQESSIEEQQEKEGFSEKKPKKKTKNLKIYRLRI